LVEDELKDRNQQD